MSAAGSVDGPSSAPPPHECGWMLVTDLMFTQPLDAPLFPRSGRCSVRLCPSSTAAAIRRPSSTRWTGYWQLYCTDHARQRGVDTREGRLDWVDGFPVIAGGRTRP